MYHPVSVIVPFFNSESTLNTCLTSIVRELGPEDELIMVDDGSKDSSLAIAGSFNGQVIKLEKNEGAAGARNKGAQAAKNSVLIFVDSDVVLTGNDIQRVREYFHINSEVSSLTTTLNTVHGAQDFFSDYKNLYMNYIFSKCEREVNFIYGSFCAIRKKDFIEWPTRPLKGEDSHWGFLQVQKELKIHLIKDIEVTHLKKYSLKSLSKNDFDIAKNFAILFLRYKRWSTVYSKEKFGHTSKNQKFSLLLAVLTSFMLVWSPMMALVLFAFWLMLNKDFFSYLIRSRNIHFLMSAILWTFVDHHIYFAGIVSGSLSYVRTV